MSIGIPPPKKKKNLHRNPGQREKKREYLPSIKERILSHYIVYSYAFKILKVKFHFKFQVADSTFHGAYVNSKKQKYVCIYFSILLVLLLAPSAPTLFKDSLSDSENGMKFASEARSSEGRYQRE